ncbi:MAG: sensor histidine kinase [Anaerolineae bacterium]
MKYLRGISAAMVGLWMVLALVLIQLTDPQALIILRFDSVWALLWFAGGLLTIVVLVAVWARPLPETGPARFASHLSDAVLVLRANGQPLWSNPLAAAALDPLPDEVAELVEAAKTSGRTRMRVCALSDARRYAVQIIPLARRRTAVIARPLQAEAEQTTFYENFIHRIVHDMRYALAGIIAHAANLHQSPTFEPESSRRSAATIEREARRLARLVDSLLFDARLAYVPLERELLHLSDVLEEAIFAADEQAMREGKTLELETQSGALTFFGDRDLLVRAFENLIDNSLKYSGDNGRLIVEVTCEAADYVIRFSDNGEGIPPEYLPDRIFEPLVRARSQGSGSGLGLSIVKKNIEMHEGSVHAASTPGTGTIITIRLPRTGETPS